MTQADKLDRVALSASLPGTWLLESRIDVTASESREPSPRWATIPLPFSSTTGTVTLPPSS